jgi:hypothetical protein
MKKRFSKKENNKIWGDLCFIFSYACLVEQGQKEEDKRIAGELIRDNKWPELFANHTWLVFLKDILFLHKERYEEIKNDLGVLRKYFKKEISELRVEWEKEKEVGDEKTLFPKRFALLENPVFMKMPKK